jgi:putative spermidine/putrescine transport system substrate-binding protein
MISSLKRIDYEKLNAAKTDWLDAWSEVFGR